MGAKLSIDNVKSKMEKMNCKFVSDLWMGTDSIYEFQCECGEIFKRNYRSVAYKGMSKCKKCVYKQPRYNALSLNDAKIRCIENGCELLCDDGEWVGTQSKYYFRCSCGNEFRRSYKIVSSGSTNCLKCSLENKDIPHKYNYEEVKSFIEIESNSGCKLVSKTYKNQLEKIKIQCVCGRNYNVSYSNFKNHGQRRCRECTKSSMRSKLNLGLEYIKLYVEELDYELLSDEYKNTNTNMEFKCLICHSNFTCTFSSIKSYKHNCPNCANINNGNIRRLSVDLVDTYLNKFGYTRESDYKSCDIKMALECPENHIFEMDFYHFKNRGQRCPICYSLKNKSGENSATWKGGVTTLNSLLRELLTDWKFKSLEKYGYKCIISGSKYDLEIHHVYSFHLIVSDVLKKLNIDNKKSVGDYNSEEINNIKKLFLKYHEDAIGVPINKKIHKLYHSVYGFNNNQSQLDEFIKKYKEEGLNTVINE